MADLVGRQLGNYRLLQVLGQGAFAAVYLGEHQYLERHAAVKVLHMRMALERHEAFRREARIIAQLHHRHIIAIHDFGIEDQTPYLVMEYTPNGTLRSGHPEGTRLSLEQIVTYVKQIALALDYAHQQRIIHRDIKPENILLSTQQEAVLSDFGIATVQSTLDSLSMQSPAGTPFYMAPEQIQGKPCAASDQYALGVMVYEWLCGEPPFRGSLFEVFNQHLYKPPPSLCARVPQLPPTVESAVMRTLAKDPQLRFVNLADFASVLGEAFFATQPLLLSRSVRCELQDQTAPPPAYACSVPVLSPSKQENSDYATQPHLEMGQRIDHEHEQVQSALPQPATYSRTTLKQTRLSLTQTNRQRLSRRVRSFWITGVLEQSLHGAALLALGLEEQPDAVANPWHLVVQHPDKTPCPLPEGTRIIQVYDQADGELLILGTPGAGKTTLLLELACDLLDRAERDEHHPMPVVFNLSSWIMKRQLLADWLVEELVSKYQVPRKLGQVLVNTDQILPLLDGLDEVAPKERRACIETINLYRQEHGLLPLVVCSRSADYLAQTTRIQLRTAVVVQPLTQHQVDDYLASGGEQLRVLRVALHQDPSLRELASTPLMLSILTLTYHGVLAEDLSGTTCHMDRQRQVFEHYVERMFKRRGADIPYSLQQTTHWLSWLAKQMKQRSQTELYIERLQPSWLRNLQERQYFRGLVCGLIFGIASAIFSGTACLIFIGPTAGFVSGVAVGLIAGLVSFMLGYTMVDLKEREHQLHDVQIHPAEMIILSRASLWGSIEKGLFYGCGGAMFFWMVMGTLFWQFSFFYPITYPIHPITSAQFFGFYVGAVLLTVILKSLSGEQLDKSALFQPNQGIRYSVRNSLLVGILSGGVVGTVVGVITGVGFGVIAGVGVGAIVGLHKGGFASIQHFLLRWLLWRVGSIPWNYPRFLDYAAERILLHKVGGGYIFIHRLLLEYFATLDTTSTPDVTGAQEQQALPV